MNLSIANKSYLSEARAIARKEIKLDLRFAVSFLIEGIIGPLKRLIPILLVYFAILKGTTTSPIPKIDESNYLPFLILGITFHTAWTLGANSFSTKFIREKYKQTIDLLFIAPIRVLAILLGIGTAVLLKSLPTFILFTLALVVISPPISVAGFFLAGIAFTFMLLFSLSLGLIKGSVALASENYLPFLQYLFAGLTFITPFYYPLEVFEKLPDIIAKPILTFAHLNPLYAGVTFARQAWIEGHSLPWLELSYLFLITLVFLFISSHIFRFVWRKYGVQG